MGGAVAWRYALSHPERLDGLVLIDAAGAPVRAHARTPLGFRLARTPVLRDVIRNLTPRALIDRSLRQAVANPAAVTSATVDRYWELLRYPGNRQATLDRFATPGTPASVDQMRRLRVPTLILWGEQDRLIPPASARWLAAHIAGSRTVINPTAGHIPMEEIPDRSATDLRRWIETLRKR
jgi:pimeloyl-ACP methyl ester carboxylesterase